MSLPRHGIEYMRYLEFSRSEGPGGRMADSSSLLPSDKITLQSACQRMRLLIKACPDADMEAMRVLFNALGALEQIALNAPENSGRLRTLQFELRDALAEFSATTGATSSIMQIQAALRDIVDILHRPRGVISGEQQAMRPTDMSVRFAIDFPVRRRAL